MRSELDQERVSDFPAAARNIFANSGSRLKTATQRNHSLCSIAGYPLTTVPGATSLGMPDCAVATAPSPILQCPATPTCPARITLLPTSLEPANPTCAHSRLSSPTDDPCPICTRLSILEPAPTL